MFKPVPYLLAVEREFEAARTVGRQDPFFLLETLDFGKSFGYRVGFVLIRELGYYVTFAEPAELLNHVIDQLADSKETVGVDVIDIVVPRGAKPSYEGNRTGLAAVEFSQKRPRGFCLLSV